MKIEQKWLLPFKTSVMCLFICWST